MSYKTDSELLWLKTPKSELPQQQDEDLELYEANLKKPFTFLGKPTRFWLVFLASILLGSTAGLGAMAWINSGSEPSGLHLLSSNRTVVTTTTIHELIMSNAISQRGESYMRPIANLTLKQLASSSISPQTNLTDLGVFRMFKLGLELRRRYAMLLSYDDHDTLGFSLNDSLHLNSMAMTLRALYNMQTTMKDGLETLDRYNRFGIKALPRGSGAGATWKMVTVSTNLKGSCPLVDELKSKELVKPLMSLAAVKSLPGIEKLERIVTQQEQVPLNFALNQLEANLESSLQAILTSCNYNLSQSHYEWLVESVAKRDSPIPGEEPMELTLFDLLRYLASFVGLYPTNRTKIQDQLEMGPIWTSIVRSQMLALGTTIDGLWEPEKVRLFQNRKLILYSYPGQTIQRMLQNVKVIRLDQNINFEQTFFELYHQPEVVKFLAGIVPIQYGATLRVDLWKASQSNNKFFVSQAKGQVSNSTRSNSTSSFAYVKMSLYNNDAIKFAPIDFVDIKLGSSCRNMFINQYPNASSTTLDEFYPQDLDSWNLDIEFDCPFELWRNVTSPMIIDDDIYVELCNQRLKQPSSTTPTPQPKHTD